MNDQNNIPTLSGKNFVELVRRSGLVEQETLSTALRDVDLGQSACQSISSALIEAGLLTDWQSERLQMGLWKGFHLGKYRVLSMLGRGGMGVVFLAQHQTLGNRVAIKVLPTRYYKHSVLLTRFIREARSAAQLNHPNITRTFDVDCQDRMHYLVMEYVQGRSIDEIVREEGPLSFEQAAKYTQQAAEGLAHAHASNLVHRDIKPSNLMIDTDDQVKLLDFGLALVTDDDNPSLTTDLASGGMGTADYVSPEQAIDSHNVNGRADIYSLGHTLYFMLTGSPPFPKGTKIERVIHHCRTQPKSISVTRPDVPPSLLHIWKRMTFKNPKNRYASAGEVSEELQQWLENGDKVAMSNPPVSVPASAGSGGDDIFGDAADLPSLDYLNADPANLGDASNVGAGESVLDARLSDLDLGTQPTSNIWSDFAAGASMAGQSTATGNQAWTQASPPWGQAQHERGQERKPTETRDKSWLQLGNYPTWLCIVAGAVFGISIVVIAISFWANFVNQRLEFERGVGDQIEVRTSDAQNSRIGSREPE